MKLKICGMRDRDNIKEVASLAPDYMGFIFYRPSPRYVGEGFDLSWFEYPIKKVGVFLNHSSAEVIEITIRNGLDVIQLHGREDLSYIAGLRRSLPHQVEIWKTFLVGESFDFSVTDGHAKLCDRFLFDTNHGIGGGSGIAFNWNVLRSYDKKLPLVLAGGIGDENLDELLGFRQSGVPIETLDLNSKVETAPGIKSIKLIRAISDRIPR